MPSVWCTVESPVGELLLAATGGALAGVFFEDHRGGADPRVDAARAGEHAPDDDVLLLAAAQLTEYFKGTRYAFSVPLAPIGTPFQHRVWTALRQVPYGSTASYGDIARRLDLPPASARAVGMANGANPISIFVPCHRVVGADGTLTGYAGGVERKQYLLELEKSPRA